MVTLQEVKEHLRIDHNDDDQYINGLISAAKCEAENYIGQPLSDFETIPESINHAIKIKVGEYYDQDRTGYVVGSMRETKAFERLLNNYVKY